MKSIWWHNALSTLVPFQYVDMPVFHTTVHQPFLEVKHSPYIMVCPQKLVHQQFTVQFACGNSVHHWSCLKKLKSQKVSQSCQYTSLLDFLVLGISDIAWSVIVPFNREAYADIKGRSFFPHPFALQQRLYLSTPCCLSLNLQLRPLKLLTPAYKALCPSCVAGREHHVHHQQC